MRVAEKMDVISRIGRELQDRYTYTEIDAYLSAFGIEPPQSPTGSWNSKWVYSKAALSSVPINTIVQITEDLELGSVAAVMASQSPPKNWDGTTDFRLFISHIAKHKDKATRLKECLQPYGISGFVAHEDINPTLEWQREIERALYCMDAMVAIHTPGFSGSYWTQQEIGFAIGRGTKVISLKMGEDPTGFISKHQALARRRRSAEDIAKEIDSLLSEDERTREKIQLARPRDVSANDEIPF